MGRAELARREATVVERGGGLDEGKIDSLDLSVHQARLAVHYKSPLPWLSAKLSIDASDKVRAKDVYVQAKGEGMLGRLGQFKMPVGAFESDSSWSLPTVDRGFLHDLLVDSLQVGGRRPGALASVALPFGVKPKLSLGAFQGSQLADDGGSDLLEADSLGAQSLLGRIDAEAGVLHFGAFYERRVGIRTTLLPGDDVEHFWTVGADLEVDWELAGGGLRLWADGYSGASWLESAGKQPDDADATFLAGRLVLAPRWGGTEKEELYVEPFALVGVLDPDLDVVRDDALELAVGINAGFWRMARLTVQAEVSRSEVNFPDAYRLEHGERRALVVQAGVAF